MRQQISPLRPPLSVGSIAVRRDVFRGRIWTRSPTRVLGAGGGTATTAIWAGVRTLRSRELIAAADGQDPAALRLRSLEALADGSFVLGTWVWRSNSFVTEIADGRWFTVTRMFAPTGALVCWYVNFERPPTWRSGGWDTFDLAVDLVVEPDGRRRWKDEDEYAHCRRLGLIAEDEHAAVTRAREEALDMLERRVGAFGADPEAAWRPDPAWPLPELPAPGTSAAPARQAVTPALTTADASADASAEGSV